MKFKTPTPLIKALLVAAIMAVLGWIGLDLPQSTIEETVGEQLDTFATDEASTSGDERLIVPAVVTGVTDGDTIVAEIDGRSTRVRLIGIDTPEVAGSPAGAECYGEEATGRATVLVLDEAVILTTDPTQDQYDDYDRLLAYVTLGDGQDLGEVLIREGYAEEFTYRYAYEKQSSYQAAEQSAQASGAGLWSACE